MPCEIPRRVSRLGHAVETIITVYILILALLPYFVDCLVIPADADAVVDQAQLSLLLPAAVR